MWRTLKAADARKLIGQEVRWRFRSGRTGAGLVHEVRGNNIRVGTDRWKWLPDIQIEVPPAASQGEEVG